MSIYRGLEALPAEWFPDREAVRAFVQGPRYFALGSLVAGVFSFDLPGALAASSRNAAFFIATDLFELARIAALPDEEPYEAPEIPSEWSAKWQDWLSQLATVALAEGYVEEIFEPIIEMQAEAEAEREALLVAKAEADSRAMAAERANA